MAPSRQRDFPRALISLRSFLRAKKEKQPAPNDPVPFTGIGTLMMSHLVGFGRSLEKMDGTPIDELAEHLSLIIKHFIDIQVKAVNAANGICLWFTSEISLAYWHPSHVNPSHAAQAFDCGRCILQEIRRLRSEQMVSLDLRVVLATGDMTLAFIGNSWQVVGRARATAERLLDLKLPLASSMLYTPETIQLIPNAPASNQAVTRIQRSTGEEVDVYQLAMDEP